MNRLLLVPGIVISAARTRPRAVTLCIRCKTCQDERFLNCPPGAESYALPLKCLGSSSAATEANAGNPNPLGSVKCPLTPYAIVTDKCRFVDQQRLKLQEAPETVPTGEMPRTVEVCVDRVYADRVAPGTRIRLIAIASLHKTADSRAGNVNAVAVRVPYLRGVGVLSDTEGSVRGGVANFFTPEEEARFKVSGEGRGGGGGQRAEGRARCARVRVIARAPKPPSPTPLPHTPSSTGAGCGSGHLRAPCRVGRAKYRG